MGWPAALIAKLSVQCRQLSIEVQLMGDLPVDQISYLADRVFVDGAFLPHHAVNCERGRIHSISKAPLFDRVLAFENKALMPGFINAHSHAFQRAIRGLVQRVPAENPQADFWTWREKMYGAALALSADDFERVTRWCYLEMLLAGITSVAEFHYIHHQADGRPYEQVGELGLRAMAAARDIGIGLELLPVAYQRGGYQIPASSAQRRFIFKGVDDYLRMADAVRVAAQDFPENISTGLAVHSIRAVELGWIERIAAHARRVDLNWHMHICEQIQEVAQCQAEHGMNPVEVMASRGLLDARFTGVHGNKMTAQEQDFIAEAGANICICPTTERDLGDGYAQTKALLDRGIPLSLGSDSHAQIDFFSEMQTLEGNERFHFEKRALLLEAGDPRAKTWGVAPRLFEIATQGGAVASRRQAGALQAGLAADMITIDLNHPILWGWQDDYLLDAVVMSGVNGMVRDVIVGGRHLVQDGKHALSAKIQGEARALMDKLWA